MRLGDEARNNLNKFMVTNPDPMFDQLSECILTAASTGAHGLDVFGYNANGDEDDGRYAYLANPDEVGVRDWVRREGLGDTINAIYWE